MDAQSGKNGGGRGRKTGTTHRLMPGRGRLFLAWVALGVCGPVWGGFQWERRTIEIPVSAVATNAVGRFSFKNIGQQTVTITSVDTGCGCMVAGLEKKTWRPGEEGVLAIHFAFGDRVGKQEKDVLVQTDDPAQATTTLTLRVAIPDPLKITPRSVFWQTGDAPAAKTIEIEVLTKAGLGVVRAQSGDPRIRVDLKAGRSRGTWQLVVTPTDTSTPTSALIRIETDSTLDKAKVFHVYAFIRPK